jgi:hypothetical protein
MQHSFEGIPTVPSHRDLVGSSTCARAALPPIQQGASAAAAAAAAVLRGALCAAPRRAAACACTRARAPAFSQPGAARARSRSRERLRGQLRMPPLCLPQQRLPRQRPAGTKPRARPPCMHTRPTAALTGSHGLLLRRLPLPGDRPSRLDCGKGAGAGAPREAGVTSPNPGKARGAAFLSSHHATSGTTEVPWHLISQRPHGLNLPISSVPRRCS